jgi:hypothetical protein
MLWAITSYFNPIGYRSRLANYRRFRANLRVPLVTVEAASDGRFELRPGDAEVLVQVPTRAVLWQKERLLNIALGHLPPGCREVAWLDCDVVLESDDWPERTRRALEVHPLVHLFSERRNLGRGGQVESVVRSCVAAIISGDAEAADLYDANAPVHRRTSLGLAWAARREVLSGGLYDACILGSGDRAILCGALGELEYGIRAVQMTPRHAEHYSSWARSFAATIGADLGCVEGRIDHLWHGEFADRRYGDRHRGLRQFGFDPYTDIALDTNGCWSWTTSNGALQDYVRRYFESRREDGR